MTNRVNVVRKAENVINFPSQRSHIAKSGNNMVDMVAIECFKKLNFQGNAEEVVAKYMELRDDVAKRIDNSNETTSETTLRPKYDVDNTVFDDYIICLEDGKKMQMLKRHLLANYGMTFQQYKEKWGLPIDYPYVCKNYSKVRQGIAKRRNMKRNKNGAD